jgi:soluble lytic murein transglycosylase-like protein
MAAMGNAQTLSEYMHMRRANGILNPTSFSTLDTIVGTRIVELSTTVKGTFKVDNRGALMIDSPDGGTVVVDCANIPDWLAGNEIKARLLIKVSREDEADETKMVLMGAAPEDQVAAYDKAPASATAKTSSKRNLRPNLASRHATFRGMRDETLPESSVTPIYAARIKLINRRLTDEDANDIARFVIGYSLKYGVDARLIMSMVMVESGFNPYATSRHGAQGLGQLMPGTAQGMGVENAYDMKQNIEAMIQIVRGNIDSYKASTGDDEKALELAIAAYNAGKGAVAKYGGIPPYTETQNYVVKVLNLYAEFTSGDR